MADTPVAVTALASNTLSADLRAGLTSVSDGNTAVIACGGMTRGLVIVLSGDGTHDGTVTVEAGDEPPSERSGLGASGTLTVDSDETYLFFAEAGRFIKNDHGDLELPVVSSSGAVYVGAFSRPITN